MRTALFPGTFDPIHSGHLNLIERGARIFDRVIVGVAEGHHKNPLFSKRERLDLARRVVDSDGVEVKPFSGLVVDFARAEGASVILRGVRTGADFEYESRMAFMNRRLGGGVEVVFLPAHSEYAHIHSSLVREIARLGGFTAPFVPEAVAERIAGKLGGKKS